MNIKYRNVKYDALCYAATGVPTVKEFCQIKADFEDQQACRHDEKEFDP